MLRKTTLALALTAISCSAFATSSTTVVVPSGVPVVALDSSGLWSVGLGVVYAKSSAPIFQYAQINSNTPTGNTLTNKTVEPSAQSGLELDLDYRFAGSNTDVGFSYTHIDMENSNTASIVGTETFDEPFDLLPSRRDHVDQIKASVENVYNGTDLVFGQHLTVGNRVDLHPFGGIRYADLDSDEKSTYYNDPSDDDSIEATAQMTSHYEGLGPRAGMDGTVHLCKGLSIVGTLAGSLEYGYDNAQIITQITSDLPTTTTLDKNWYVVPELDTRLGLDYAFAFNQTTSMDIQAGYQAVSYFNALENDQQDISDINSQVSKANFGFQGPYARIQLNIA